MEIVELIEAVRGLRVAAAWHELKLAESHGGLESAQPVPCEVPFGNAQTGSPRQLCRHINVPSGLINRDLETNP